MNVLLMQDRPFMPAAMQLFLKEKGFNLVVSDTLSLVGQKVNEVNPCVIIADITSGVCFDVIARAKSENIPVIVLSISGNEDDLQTAFEFGADDYMCLPLTLQELALRVMLLSRSKKPALA